MRPAFGEAQHFGPKRIHGLLMRPPVRGGFRCKISHVRADFRHVAADPAHSGKRRTAVCKTGADNGEYQLRRVRHAGVLARHARPGKHRKRVSSQQVGRDRWPAPTGWQRQSHARLPIYGYDSLFE